MGFLKDASGQYLARFQIQQSLFFFPRITIMLQIFMSTRFAAKHRNHLFSV